MGVSSQINVSGNADVISPPYDLWQSPDFCSSFSFELFISALIQICMEHLSPFAARFICKFKMDDILIATCKVPLAFVQAIPIHLAIT